MRVKFDLSGLYLMTRVKFLTKYGTDRPRCKSCGKYYRVPGTIFAPRDEICFTCEVHYKTVAELEKVLNAKFNNPMDQLDNIIDETFKKENK